MSQVLYEVRNGIGFITLNRPDKLNTLSYELMAGFHDADMGLFQLLLERVPINIIKEWISFVPTLTVPELLKYGVINKVVSGSILDEAINFIQPLTEASPLSLLYSKQILNHMNQSSLDESILQENVHQTMLLKSLDHREGVKAFYEKRKPSFFGK